MAVKHFRKTANGTIEVPTLKTYNDIELNFVKKEFDKTLPYKYLPTFHSMATFSTSSGSWNYSRFFGGNKLITMSVDEEGYEACQLHLIDDAISKETLKEFLINDVASSFYAMQVYKYWTYGLFFSFLYNPDVPKAVLGMAASSSEATSEGLGLSSGLFKFSDMKGIEGLTSEQLAIGGTSADFCYGIEYVGSNTYLNTLIELGHKFYYGTEEEVNTLMSNFKFYSINLSTGTKTEVDSSTTIGTTAQCIMDAVHIFKYDNAAWYKPDGYLDIGTYGIQAGTLVHLSMYDGTESIPIPDIDTLHWRCWLDETYE